MNLQNRYVNEIKGILAGELGIKNPLAIPRLLKIVVNVGLGEALTDHKVLDRVAQQLSLITGQKPLVTKAKTSIASFKLRAGEKIGLKVTLRGKRMYIFLEKLISVVLPRVRDFRGIPKRSFDKSGNYSLGIHEQTVFPEIDYDKVDKTRGLEITLVTSAQKAKDAQVLLEKLGMPFEKNENIQRS